MPREAPVGSPRRLAGANPLPSRLLFDTILLGLVGAFSARLFDWLLGGASRVLIEGIGGYSLSSAGPGGEVHPVLAHGIWLIPVVTTLGGLLSGVLVYSLAPEAEGHGTDTVVRTYHHEGGAIRPRVTPLKMLASAITIGSGGAAGREGPTALISAGVGSFYATYVRRSDEERPLLVLIGMAAGLSAIFRSPIGTALFAIEVLYSEMELETRALLYTMLGSIVAYAVNGAMVGWEPLFQFQHEPTLVTFAGYSWYVLLGAVAGVVGAILPLAFYRVRDAFRLLPVPPHVKPAIGGLAVGLLGMGLPQVLGGGYVWIQQAIDGKLAPGLLGILVFAKMAAFVFTVSSGGSGGVFAPTLFVGAMLGGVLAPLCHQPSAAFVVVGMAAVFAAAARVPIATLLMVTEMTGGYQLLVPAGLAVVLAFMVQGFVSSVFRFRYRSLYEAQVPSPTDSPAHHAEHLRIALSLVDQRRLPLDEQVGHLRLLALLRLGIPVDLPDGKKLVLVRLRAESPCVGSSVAASPLGGRDGEAELVAISRDRHLFLPHPESVLNAGDQLLMLGSVAALSRIAEHLESSPVEPARDRSSGASDGGF